MKTTKKELDEILHQIPPGDPSRAEITVIHKAIMKLAEKIDILNEFAVLK